MRFRIHRYSILFTLLFLAGNLSAQSAGDSSPNYLLIGLIVISAFILIAVVLQVADNLLRIEAKQIGAEKSGANYSLFPNFNEIFRPKMPEYTSGQEAVVLSDGHDILLEGNIESTHIHDAQVQTFAIRPVDFIGMSPIPKVTVEVGEEVKAGDILFFDKKSPDTKYVSPVSGEVIAVNRGEKRAITEVVVLADKDQQYRSLNAPSLDATREELINFLQETGGWSLIRQRPYNIIADPMEMPKSIFVSTFDTAPLAPNLNVVVRDQERAFQKGLDVLNQLTVGKVHLGLNAKADEAPARAFTEATGVEKHWFHGKHPAGNVGIQIHHIDPVGSNQKVWTAGVQEVITLGKMFMEGRYDATRIVALTGAELKEPKYVRTYQGASISELLKDNIDSEGKVRYISGDVLSGSLTSPESFLGFYDDQVTVILEGDQYEMFGWLLPIKPRPTISGTFPNGLFPDLRFRANSNTHGEKRAFVYTGDYESVLPVDVDLQALLKSIIVNDFERMEGLGLYELVEEDVALAEFVCVSKQPVQQILREGLDTMRVQG